MSLVSGFEFITAMVDGDQLSAALIPTKPLSQYLKKGTGNVSPDWTLAKDQPVVYVRVKSQLQGNRREIVTGTEKWYYNGSEIRFDDAGISTLPSGIFQKLVYDDGGVPVPGLKIIRNLASPTNTDNDRIEFSGKVQLGSLQTEVYPNIDIRVEETTGDPYDGYIDATEGGVIDNDTSQIVCTAFLLKGGAPVVNGITYKWYVASGNGWTSTISDSGKSNQKTVKAGDIDSEMILKCEFLIDGQVAYAATRQLSDETDPLIIASSPNGTTVLPAGGSVTFSPKVVRRSNGAIQSGYSFSYTTYNNRDTKIGSSSGSSISITRAEVDANYGGIKLYISASK